MVLPNGFADSVNAPAATVSTSIRCMSLTKRFPGGGTAVADVSLDAEPGKITSLVGPSGCGKTTCLRLMSQLEKPTEGTVVLDPPASGNSGEIGFVFQQPALLRWRTAFQNVMLPMELIGRPAAVSDRQDKAIDLLTQVGLSDAVNRFPNQLSGGMQMRVSIARALVTEPKVLFLDEPFAALDDMLRSQLGGLLLDLWRERQLTAVMVTHNIAEAIMLSHQVLVMRDGQVCDVINSDLGWPRSESMRRTASFGEMYGRVSDAISGHESDDSIAAVGGESPDGQ